jgi:hypothetical protein
MQPAGSAVGGDHLRECSKNAALVVGVSGKASIAHCLVEAASVLCCGGKSEINVRVAHGLRLVLQAGWL